jgi:hypothetical protein
MSTKGQAIAVRLAKLVWFIFVAIVATYVAIYGYTKNGIGGFFLGLVVGALGGAMYASRPSFGRYLYARLGPGSPGQCLRHMFSRAFGASDFTRFWQYWNPFLGYFLGYFCYAPLRRFAPRSLCLIITFAVNGFFFHDLVYLWPWGAARTDCLPFPFPIFTLSLAINAVIILAAERYRFTLARLSLPMRVACHLLAFVGPFAFSVGVLLLLRVYDG